MMKKKQILFIMNNLQCGGAEKALVSLLQTIDYSLYDVDLFLLKKEGLFLDQVPQEVHIIDYQSKLYLFDMPIKKALIECVKKIDIKSFVIRVLSGFVYSKDIPPAQKEQKVWRYLKHVIPFSKKNYDVAIGFLEKTPSYYCIDKVNATKKIAWIHTELSNLKLNFKKEEKYFNKFDAIIVVSEEISKSLKIRLPKLENKILFLENIVSSTLINKLALKKDVTNYNDSFFNLVFVGRIAKEKGLFMALEALNILINKGYNIRWYIVGEGDQKEELIKLATNYKIIDNIFFTGLTSNPYPYIKNASAYILPSFYEGKSISLEEAKTLNIPIVVTNFSSASNQIEHNENGLIADMNEQSIADKLELLINSLELQEKFIKNLKKTEGQKTGVIDQFYKIIS